MLVYPVLVGDVRSQLYQLLDC